MRPAFLLPVPLELLSFTVGDSPLKVGMLCEVRKGLLYPHSTPGGSHSKLFVADEELTGYIQEVYEPGEQCYVVHPFGRHTVTAILRRGERVSCGAYERGSLLGGTDLVSAGDGSGALVAHTRFIGAEYVGQALEDLDLTVADEDQLITIKTHY